MKELAFWTRIYLKMEDKETKEQAIKRLLDTLEKAGVDYLDPQDEQFEVIDV